MFPPGRPKLATRPAPTGSVICRKMIGTLRVNGAAGGHDDVGCKGDKFARVSTITFGIPRAKTEVNSYVVAAGPAQLLQRLQERRITGLRLCIVRCQIGEQADPPHALALLRARRERPCRRCAAEQRY